MTDRPGQPTPTPVTPRASDSWSAGPEDDGAGEMGELLERFAALTALAPRSDWVRQVHLRIAREPSPTPSRRFFLALTALAPGEAAAALAQSVRAAFGRGRFPAVVRAQAMAVVLLVVLSVGVVGAGGALVLNAVVLPPDGPTRTLPAVAPSLTPTLRPTQRTRPPAVEVEDLPPLGPTRSAAAASAEPEPSVAPPSPHIDRNAPSPSAFGPGIGGPPETRPSSRPRPTPRADDPARPNAEKTQKPRPTPNADKSLKPRPTPKADRTPKPSPTPKPVRSPKPRPTPKADRTPRPDKTPKANRSPRPRRTPEAATSPTSRALIGPATIGTSVGGRDPGLLRSA